jgi:hypothetical protein
VSEPLTDILCGEEELMVEIGRGDEGVRESDNLQVPRQLMLENTPKIGRAWMEGDVRSKIQIEGEVESRRRKKSGQLSKQRENASSSMLIAPILSDSSIARVVFVLPPTCCPQPGRHSSRPCSSGLTLDQEMPSQSESRSRSDCKGNRRRVSKKGWRGLANV